jgi:hypothetical protein
MKCRILLTYILSKHQNINKQKSTVTCEISGSHYSTDKNSNLLPEIVYVTSKTQAVNIRVLESSVLRTKSEIEECKAKRQGRLHNEIFYSSPCNTNMMTLKEIR